MCADLILGNILDTTRFIIVVGAIILSGILGGISSYWIENSSDTDNNSINWRKVLGLTCLGVSASFISPLFLEIFNAGGDSIIFSLFSADPEKQKNFPPYLLLLFSYCCLFSVFARRFLISAYNQLVNSHKAEIISEAKSQAATTAMIESDKQSRLIVEDQAEELRYNLQGTDLENALQLPLSETEEEILNELDRSKVSTVPISEIKVLHLNKKEDFDNAIDHLVQIGFVKLVDKNGDRGLRLRVRGAAKLKQNKN